MTRQFLPAFDPDMHVLHRAQVGSSTPMPSPPPGFKLERVWRVLNVSRLKEEGLVHNRTAFLEDVGHDWKITSSGELRYSTRQGEPGEWLDIVLDFDPPHVYKLRTQSPRFDPMTGRHIGEEEVPVASVSKKLGPGG